MCTNPQDQTRLNSLTFSHLPIQSHYSLRSAPYTSLISRFQQKSFSRPREISPCPSSHSSRTSHLTQQPPARYRTSCPYPRVRPHQQLSCTGLLAPSIPAAVSPPPGPPLWLQMFPGQWRFSWYQVWWRRRMTWGG